MTNATWDQLQPFLLALALGLLMGLERERRVEAKAGVRTFALVALLGALTAFVAREFDAAWLIGVGLAAVAALIIVPYLGQPPEADPGTTSMAALLVCYGLGVLIEAGHRNIAVPLGIAVTGLLYFKAELRGIASRLSQRDWLAMLQFAALALIVLPILPDRDLGPYEALNPYNVWLMVVLISGVSLAGYAALRLFGARQGAPMLGLLGGLVSSTATTMVFARHSRGAPALVPTALVVILLANLVMTVRLAGIAAVLAPGLFETVLITLAPGFVFGLAFALFDWRRLESTAALPLPEVRNPAEIRSALGFGALYAIVLLAAAWLSDLAGSRGLYVVSLVSGLTDVDAITLSTLRLRDLGKVADIQAVTAIAIAVMANLAFKFALAASIGGRALAQRIAPSFAAVAAGIGLGLLGTWA